MGPDVRGAVAESPDVQPCLVIPEQPVEGFILSLAKGFKVLPVQPLYLQRSEQRLAACVVPAVALATHRGSNSALFEHAVELVTGVLAASVAVKNQRCLRSGLAVWRTSEPGHIQSVDHQLTPHVCSHRPAHHLAAG